MLLVGAKNENIFMHCNALVQYFFIILKKKWFQQGTLGGDGDNHRNQFGQPDGSNHPRCGFEQVMSKLV
jgi:hypothetical protein